MKQLALFSLVLVFLYLLISFFTLHFDFRLWNEAARFAYAWFIGFIFIGFLIWYIAERESL